MTIITTASEFNDLCLSLSQSVHDFIAVDTEFVREKTYWPHWSLLQLATVQDTYIVDVTNLNFHKDFEAFKNLLLHSSITKVFHACRQDIEIFLHELDVIPNTIFDCQVAAYICGFSEGVGLAKLAQELLGIEVTKAQQHTNWLSRPLSPKQISYATMDVEIIQKLYHALDIKLSGLGRWGWLHYEQAHFFSSRTYLPDLDGLWCRIKTHHKMKPSKRALLQELCRWREEKAQEMNYNRARVATDDILVRIVDFMPEDIIGLADMVPEISINYLEEIWELLLAFRERNPYTYPKLKNPPFRPPYLIEAFEKIAWLRHQAAFQLNVAERLLATDEAIKNFISGMDVNFNHNWRYEVFGRQAEEILKPYLQIENLNNTIG